MKLDNLKIHSMQVQGPALAVDFDGNVSVHWSSKVLGSK